ncbi:transposase [Duganella sp. 1224]|nr:transposase [Duganella sp. 1224]
MLEQLRTLEERIARTNQWITSFLKSSALCKKIEAIDGVGPITATAIVAAVGTLLIHGARVVLRYAIGKADARSRWLQDLIARRGYNRAAVALANKNARVIQVLLSGTENYRSPAVPA